MRADEPLSSPVNAAGVAILRSFIEEQTTLLSRPGPILGKFAPPVGDAAPDAARASGEAAAAPSALSDAAYAALADDELVAASLRAAENRDVFAPASRPPQ
jgi:hypothetical protein